MVRVDKGRDQSPAIRKAMDVDQIIRSRAAEGDPETRAVVVMTGEGLVAMTDGGLEIKARALQILRRQNDKNCIAIFPWRACEKTRPSLFTFSALLLLR